MPDPVRLRPFLLSASDPGRGGAKLTSPLWLRLFSPSISGFGPSPGKAPARTAALVVSRVLGKASLSRGSEGGKRDSKRALLRGTEVEGFLGTDASPSFGLLLPGFNGKISGL